MPLLSLLLPRRRFCSRPSPQTERHRSNSNNKGSPLRWAHRRPFRSTRRLLQIRRAEESQVRRLWGISRSFNTWAPQQTSDRFPPLRFRISNSNSRMAIQARRQHQCNSANNPCRPIINRFTHFTIWPKIALLWLPTPNILALTLGAGQRRRRQCIGKPRRRHRWRR